MGIETGGIQPGELRTLSEISVIPDSGVSRWDFEDDSDTSTAVDVWNGYDLSLNGPVYSTSEVYEGSYSLEFDGVDDAANAGTIISEINNVSEFSIAVWVYPRRFNYDYDQIIVSQGDDWDNSTVLREKDGEIQFCGKDVTTDNATVPSSSLSTNNWYMVTGVFDGTNTEARIYLNDTKKDTVSENSTSVDTSSNFRWGELSWSSAEVPFDMYADDTRVYDKALTDTEVSNLYNTGSI